MRYFVVSAVAVTLTRGRACRVADVASWPARFVWSHMLTHAVQAGAVSVRAVQCIVTLVSEKVHTKGGASVAVVLISARVVRCAGVEKS